MNIPTLSKQTSGKFFGKKAPFVLCALLSPFLVTLPAHATPLMDPSAPLSNPLYESPLHEADLEDGTDAFLGPKAEAAAEEYNQAKEKVKAAQAKAVLLQKDQLQKEQASQSVHLDLEKAKAFALEAQAKASFMQDKYRDALLFQEASQKALNEMVAGSYKSGGEMAMASSMLEADPMTYLTNKEMLKWANRNQQDVVTELNEAKERAKSALLEARSYARTALTAQEEVNAKTLLADKALLNAKNAAATAQEALKTAQEEEKTANLRKLAADRAISLLSTPVSPAELARLGETARLQALNFAPAVPSDLSYNSPAMTAVRWALAQAGTPYSWGGGNTSGPTLGIERGANTVGFDCSGLTMFAYAKAGISLGHYTGLQWNSGPHVMSVGDLLPGDLIFYGNPIHHVTMYIGNGMMVEAPHTGDVVKVTSFRSSGYVGAVRPENNFKGPYLSPPAKKISPEAPRPTDLPSPPLTRTTPTPIEPPVSKPPVSKPPVSKPPVNKPSATTPPEAKSPVVKPSAPSLPAPVDTNPVDTNPVGASASTS